MTSPPICVVSAAASRTMPAASIRLNIAQPAVAPVSAIIACTNASLRASSAAAALLERGAARVGAQSRTTPGTPGGAVGHGAGLDRRHGAGALATSLVIGLMRSKFMANPPTRYDCYI